jgi:hypothetical protein
MRPSAKTNPKKTGFYSKKRPFGRVLQQKNSLLERPVEPGTLSSA